MATDRTKGTLDLLLLTILKSGPAHGYEVINALRERSGGHFDLPEGTVYPSLHRLEGAGFLASEWDDSAPRRRRIYRLTASGRRELAAEQSAWSRFSQGINAVLGAPA